MNKKIKLSITTGFLFLGLLNIQNAFCAENPNDIKERYNVYYNNGVTLYKDKKYTSAINEFKKVLRYVPYDKNVKNALYTAYVSRAEYYLNSLKQPKNAINDLKSALFYMKYWSDTENVDTAKVSSIEGNLNALLKKYENLTTSDLKFQNAKNLRANGEIAAAGYDLNKLASSSFSARIILYDIYKSLNNQQMALENIRAALKLQPENAIAHFKYAVLLEEINNTNAADDEYALAFKYSDKSPEVLTLLKNLWSARIANNPKDTQALINLGALYQKNKQYDLANAQYLKAQDLNPSDPVVLSNLASLRLETKDYQGALDIYDLMLSRNPKDLKPYFYKADAYRKIGNNKNAIAEYKKVLALVPDNNDAKDGINDIIANLSGNSLIAYLREDADTNPYDAQKQFDAAYELHKAKDYQNAIAYYKKAITLNPKMAESYINIAQIYRLQNDNTKADAAISHGLSNIPDNKELLAIKNDIKNEEAGNLYNSALEFFNAGNYKSALENYLKIQIQTPEVLYAIASCYFEMNENEKAIEYFKKALEKKPDDTKAMYFIANSYANLKNNAAAKEFLNKILVLEPSNADAKNLLTALTEGEEGQNLDMAISLYEKKEYNAALPLLDKVLAQNPKNAYAHYYKGIIYEETKQPDLAIKEYKNTIGADSGFSLAYYMLAVLLDDKEQYREAVIYYDKYLSLQANVEDDYSKYVKTRVKELKDYLGQK